MTLAFKIPADYKELTAVLRERAELAQLELKRGPLLGPAMTRHITDGLGHPEMALVFLEMLDKLVAAAPVNLEAAEKVKDFTERTTKFVERVQEFVNQRPECITAIENCLPDNTADYHRWQGGAEARRQLATELGWTVPHLPGETAVKAAETPVGGE